MLRWKKWPIDEDVGVPFSSVPHQGLSGGQTYLLSTDHCPAASSDWPQSSAFVNMLDNAFALVTA